MPILQARIGAAGGVGDATAANQNLQLVEATQTNSLIQDNFGDGVFKDPNAANSIFKNANGTSVFKNQNEIGAFFNNRDVSTFLESTNESVFTDLLDLSVFKLNTNESLIYKTIRNQRTGLIRENNIQTVVFTGVSAIAANTLLQNFLATNDLNFINLTACQGAGTHDLFLTYSL